jgi:peptidoglycan hydrolase-like protein with peptidoglycan-binding domain
VTGSDLIFAVQKRLLELGYSGLGPPDGAVGLKTEAAILNFKNRNGLLPRELVVIDTELLKALQSAPQIELPAYQVAATAAEIAPHVEAVKQTLGAKFWAKACLWSSSVVSVVIGIVDNLGDAVNALAPVKGFLSESLAQIPPVFLVLIALAALVAVSALLAWKNKQVETALVGGYRNNSVHNDNKELAP